MGATAFYLLMLQKYNKSKQKILKQRKHSLWLENISENFSANNKKKKKKQN